MEWALIGSLELDLFDYDFLGLESLPWAFASSQPDARQAATLWASLED